MSGLHGKRRLTPEGAHAIIDPSWGRMHFQAAPHGCRTEAIEKTIKQIDRLNELLSYYEKN